MGQDTTLWDKPDIFRRACAPARGVLRAGVPSLSAHAAGQKLVRGFYFKLLDTWRAVPHPWGMSTDASTIEASAVALAGRTWAHLHLPRLRAGDPECISVKVPGRKITYTSGILLRNVVFHVSETGRQRTLRDGVRNVHAWVVGDATSFSVAPSTDKRAIYDPWKSPYFCDADTLEPIHTASYAWLVGKTVYYV